jgi:two-component system, sensor histidine kinase PdtaS
MVPQQGIGLHSPIRPRMPEQRAIASYERELAEYEGALLQLRGRLSRQETLGRQKDDLILQQEVLGREAEHRLLNGLQMTVSLLSLQSRAETNVEASLQLAVAANRVATIARVHRRLQSLGGAQAVRFKRCLEDLCGEYSEMRAAEQQPGPAILVEGIEITVATATAMPLSLIANELVTNAIKHGKGQIKVALEAHPEKGHAL